MRYYANQLTAAVTLSKYSLLATLRSPVSVVFSLLFPIIFIVVFGSMIGDKTPEMKVAMAPGSDTINMVYQAIEKIPAIRLEKIAPSKLSDDLNKGRIMAIIQIKRDSGKTGIPQYRLKLSAGGASGPTIGQLRLIVNDAADQINQKMFPQNHSAVSVSITKVPGRTYRSIDFILPGQLGFSLLMAGVYGSSFLLFSLRQGLVFKRLRVTPIRRSTIIAGEMLSRLFFHAISFMIMVSLGYFIFRFTLINGLATFAEMLVFSLLGLFIFMGIGFMISGMVQNENAIAPIANTVVLPQILLCGLFFPLDNYPCWLQHFCNLLPLTAFVDGLRKIAFEGVHIWQLPFTILNLAVWMLIITPLAVKSFRWE